MRRPLDDGMVDRDAHAGARGAPAIAAADAGVALSGEAVAQYPDKPFHRRSAPTGSRASCDGAAEPQLEDLSHPYIAVDMSRCIDCYRCVRICDEVQGQFVWHVRDRGVETRIVPDGPTLLESSCVSCGACVDTCPTGALEDRRSLALRRRRSGRGPTVRTAASGAR